MADASSAQENNASDKDQTPERNVSEDFDNAQLIKDRIADLNMRKEKILKAREEETGETPQAPFLKIKAIPDEDTETEASNSTKAPSVSAGSTSQKSNASQKTRLNMHVSAPRAEDRASAAVNMARIEEDLGAYEAEYGEYVPEPLAISTEIPEKPVWQKLANYAGVALTITWVLGGIMIMFQQDIGQMGYQGFGGLLAAMLGPVAFFWMVMGHMQRSADIQRYSEALRYELQSIIFPSEQRAERVHADIEKLCQQAAHLAASSKAVIKAISRSRQGLRSEVRDFMGVAKKTEQHIDKMSLSLNEKGEKLLALTAEIEARTSGIDQSVQKGTNAWDQATMKILERAGEMEAAMGRGADSILEATETAEERAKGVENQLSMSVGGVEEAVDKIAQRLKDISVKFDGHADGMKSSADSLVVKVDDLSVSLDNQREAFEDIIERSMESMAESRDLVQQHESLLEQSTDNLDAHLNKFTDAVNVNLSSLDDGAQQVILKTQDLEARLDNQVIKLRDAAGGITTEAEKIEEAGVSAAHKLSESMSVALTGAETVSSAVRRGIESLEKATQSAQDQAESLIGMTRTHIEKLNEAGEGNVEHIKRIVGILERSREQIEEAATLADEQVSKLSVAVDQQTEKLNMTTHTLTERVDSVGDALSRPLASITAAITDADMKHKEIEETLMTRVSDLNDAGYKARETSEDIRSVLSSQIEEISTMSGEISAHTRAMNDQLDKQKRLLGDEVKSSIQEISAVSSALETQAERLGSVSVKAVDDVTYLETTLRDKCHDIDGTTSVTLDKLNSLNTLMTENTSAIRESSAQACKSLDHVMRGLSDKAEAFAPLFETSMDRAVSMTNRFEVLKDTYQDSTETTLKALQSVGASFDERLHKMRNSAEEAAELLHEASGHIQTRTADIETAAGTAQENIEAVQESLATQSSDIYLMTDQALLKFDSVQKKVHEQFLKLSESVGKSVARLTTVSESVESASAGAEEAADSIVMRFDNVGEKIREHSESLSISASKTVSVTEELMSNFYKETEKLVHASKDTLLEFRKTSDSFAIKVQAIQDQVDVAIKSSHDYTSELKSQADTVADVSTMTTDKINEALSLLTGKMDDVGGSAKGVVTEIVGARDKLAETSDAFLSISTKAARAAEDASESFSIQSDKMFKIVQDVTARIEKIRREETRVQKDGFMSSSKFIVESLHSLSVDFTRMLEGEVPEKAWKSYQKGDIAAFTTRLAALGDDMPIEKIREKFTDDHEFRTYVQRFLRQFEELYEQAVANDHSHLLGTTFVSSDIGKLYTTLCHAAGRETKFMKGKASKAA